VTLGSADSWNKVFIGADLSSMPRLKLLRVPDWELVSFLLSEPAIARTPHTRGLTSSRVRVGTPSRKVELCHAYGTVRSVH
jgi:hypothetical protein